MIENINVTFFRNILDFDNKTYDNFFNFVSDISDLMKDIIYNDWLILQYNFVDKFINNDYSFEGIDDLMKTSIDDNYKFKLSKMASYLKYLVNNGKINLQSEIDVIKYYGSLENVPKEIYPYGNVDNSVTLESVTGYAEYLSNFWHCHVDNVVPLIILDIVSLEDIEKHYDTLTETFKNICMQYKDVIKELESRNLKKCFNDYILSKNIMFYKMLEYLKSNYSKKDKIYDVLKKVEELKIVNVNIRNKDNNSIHEVEFSHFDVAKIKHGREEESLEDGYAGTYIYTDGIKKWLLQKENPNTYKAYQHTYVVEIRKFNYILFNHKHIDWGEDEFFWPCAVPYLSKTTELDIYDFDIDINTFPTYEELNDFKIKPQFDSVIVKNKTAALNSILQVESLIKDTKKLLDNLESLKPELNIIKDYKEYLDTFSSIDSLKNLITKMKNMKFALCNAYSEQGIMELEEIETLKVLKK